MNTDESEPQGGTGEIKVLGSDGLPILGYALGIGGGVVGAVLGYFLFVALAGQGFYAIVLPGALAGLGCGALSGRKSNLLGIICVIIALIAGILSEWRMAPFLADRSLRYFLAHLHQLRGFTHFLILLGGFCAFWFGRGRAGGAWLRRQEAGGE